MPKKVTVPGVGVVSFPDAMSDDEMAHAIDDIVATNRGAAPAAAPSSGGAIADAARGRLAAAGTTPTTVKQKAAAGENPDPKAATMYERVASDVAATVGGAGQLLGGIVAGIPEQLYNITTAAPRSAHAAANVILSGGSLEDALQAAKNVQPHRELEDLAGRAGEDARVTIRNALGVRGSAIVPQEDIMQQVPAALAILQGAIKTPEMFARRAVPAGGAALETGRSEPPAAQPETSSPAELPEDAGAPDEFRRKAARDFVDESRQRLLGEDRIPYTPEMTAVAKRLRFHLRADDNLGYDSAREAIEDGILKHPDFAERWGVSEATRAEGNNLRELFRQELARTSGDVVKMPFGGRAAVPEMPDEDVATGPNSDAELLADAGRRMGGARPSDFFQKRLQDDANRRTPEAAIARADLPLDEFVKARFPRATLTPDRDAAWTKSILDGAQEGKPGFSIDEAPEVLKKTGIDRQLVYRDPDGKPIGVANVVDGEAGEAPLVRDFAVDKSQGLLAGRAAGAIASELERAGSFEHMKEISPDAARFVQKAEAYRARAAVKEGSPKPPGPGSGGGDNSDGSGGAPPPAAPPSAAPSGAGTPSGPAGTLPEIDSRDFGPALRTLYTGERDVRAAEANVLADKIRKLVPDHVDREALTLARDFKADPQKMSEYLNPEHPAYDGLSEDARAAAHANMLKLQPVIERALDPTPEMTVANAALTSYFDRTLAEGKELGFLDSKTPAEQYINHLLQPKDAEEGVSVDRPSPSRMNRFTPNARERYYPTVLDAVANGVNPRTLDVADAVSIYGDKHGMAAATNILIDTLKMSDLGRFATDSTAPEGWAEVGAGTRIFRNEVPFIDEQGNPQVAHQALYAPKDVADALRPITDPDWTSTVPGFRASRMYQAYIKSVELGLSVFHMRALNITALNNEGLAGLVKSYGADVDSPQFIEAEKTFLKSGGTTSITGRTIEAYRAANPKSLPSTLDVIRGLPVLKQLDQFAGATSKLTFDIMQRKFKVVDFSIKNAKWIADHPNASPRELAAAQRSIAKEINSAYGGLNWEALGVNRGTHSLAKAIFLAPDWTFSNWQTAKTSFEGSPGGKAARAFWLRSAITGMALTQATSMLLSGRKSDNPTMVYLGKDKAGKGIYQNMFFAGAPADLVTLIGNVKDYGLFEGTALSLANKLAPFARMAVHAASNKNFLGQDIVPKGSGIVAGTGRAVLNLGSDVVPVPFSASNLVQMLTDRKRQYTPLEYLTTMLTGARSRHIKDERQTREKTRNSTWKIITGSPVYKGRGQ